jgi:hypothetical protein
LGEAREGKPEQWGRKRNTENVYIIIVVVKKYIFKNICCIRRKEKRRRRRGASSSSSFYLVSLQRFKFFGYLLIRHFLLRRTFVIRRVCGHLTDPLVVVAEIGD